MLRRVCCALTTSVALGLTPHPMNASETEVLIRYDSYCTVGFIRSCASVHLHSLTTGEGTTLSIYLQNLQGTNPVDNTGGSTFHQVRGAPLPEADLVGGGSVEPVGSVEVHGSPSFGAYMFESLYVDFLDLDDSFILGCNIPWESGQFIDGSFLFRSYIRTCPRNGLDGWATLSIKHPAQFTALDLTSFSWSTLSGNDDDGWRWTTCTPTNPDSCVRTVPEPGLLLLLATGLCSVAVVGLWRRPQVRE